LISHILNNTLKEPIIAYIWN